LCPTGPFVSTYKALAEAGTNLAQLSQAIADFCRKPPLEPGKKAEVWERLVADRLSGVLNLGITSAPDEEVVSAGHVAEPGRELSELRLPRARRGGPVPWHADGREREQHRDERDRIDEKHPARTDDRDEQEGGAESFGREPAGQVEAQVVQSRGWNIGDAVVVGWNANDALILAE